MVVDTLENKPLHGPTVLQKSKISRRWLLDLVVRLTTSRTGVSESERESSFPL